MTDLTFVISVRLSMVLNLVTADNGTLTRSGVIDEIKQRLSDPCEINDAIDGISLMEVQPDDGPPVHINLD